MEDQQSLIREKIKELNSQIDELPCVVIVHNIQRGFAVEFMSKRGIKLLGISEAELLSMGDDYYTQFFNPEEYQDYNKKIFDLLQNPDAEKIMSFFQQVKGRKSEGWTWYMTTFKIFMFDEKGLPLLLITTAFPIDPEHQITTKVARLLKENNFLRKNTHSFSKLSKREKEILQLMALGMGSQEIADKLFISLNTVKTHRKRVVQKLEIKNSYDLNEYARAFDLI